MRGLFLVEPEERYKVYWSNNTSFTILRSDGTLYGKIMKEMPSTMLDYRRHIIHNRNHLNPTTKNVRFRLYYFSGRVSSTLFS